MIVIAAASPILICKPGSLSNFRSAFASLLAFALSTSSPLTPSSITSGTPPTLLATTGILSAMASSKPRGNPSSSEGCTATAHRARSGNRSSNQPRKMTFFSRSVAITALTLATALFTTGSWLTFGGDPQRSGWAKNETIVAGGPAAGGFHGREFSKMPGPGKRKNFRASPP